MFTVDVKQQHNNNNNNNVFIYLFILLVAVYNIIDRKFSIFSLICRKILNIWTYRTEQIQNRLPPKELSGLGLKCPQDSRY